MRASIQRVAKIYGMLLCLFPRDFQNEFKQEMVDVFTANLAEAAKTGTTLVVRACFFELLDLPVNLLVEHLSALRKGNIMETFSFRLGLKDNRYGFATAVGLFQSVLAAILVLGTNRLVKFIDEGGLF